MTIQKISCLILPRIQAKSKNHLNHRCKGIRQLGDFERLLLGVYSSEFIISNSVVVYILAGTVDFHSLYYAVEGCIERNPILRSHVFDDEEGQLWWEPCHRDKLKSCLLAYETVNSFDEFEEFWKREMEKCINGQYKFPAGTPLWRMISITWADAAGTNASKTAWILAVNHAMGDQLSANSIISDILFNMNKSIAQHHKVDVKKASSFPMPLETFVAPEPFRLMTLLYILYQASNYFAKAVLLPDKVVVKRSVQELQIFQTEMSHRSTIIETFSLSHDTLQSLKKLCRKNSVGLSDMLSATALILSSYAIVNKESFIGCKYNPSTFGKKLDSNWEYYRNYRLLIAVSLRSYESQYLMEGREDDNCARWSDDTIVLAAGAMDFIFSISDKFSKFLLEDDVLDLTSSIIDCTEFWSLARKNKALVRAYIGNKFIHESIRCFRYGIKYINIDETLKLVANSPQTLGRGYTAGLSNIGAVYFPTAQLSDGKTLVVESLAFGTDLSKNGVLCQISSAILIKPVFGHSTDNNRKEQILCCTLEFADPIINRTDAVALKFRLHNFLQKLAKVSDPNFFLS